MSTSLTRLLPARSFVVAIAATLAGTVLLSGCGGDDAAETGAKAVAKPNTGTSEPASDEPYAGLEPAEVIDLVADTTAKAKTVQIKATYKEDTGDVKFDMRFTKAAGGRASGTMTDASSGAMKLIAIGKDGYLQLSKDFIKKSGGDPSGDMHKQWAKLSKDSEMQELFTLLTMNAFINDLLDLSAPTDGLVQVEGKKYAGRETIGYQVEGTPGIIYVAADGSGEMVAYKHPDANAVFSNWNKKMKIQPPAGAITEEELYGGGF